MSVLLKSWGCTVHGVTSLARARFNISQYQYRPDLMLVDYHLNNDENGLDVMDVLRDALGHGIPGVLITADVSTDVRELARERGYKYLSKPLNAGRLRNIVSRLAKAKARVRHVG
jgi:CheY-like chemotaxis protein